MGTAAGTFQSDANVCLSSTHCATLIAVKFFDWDDAKNAKLRAERGIDFEEIIPSRKATKQ